MCSKTECPPATDKAGASVLDERMFLRVACAFPCHEHLRSSLGTKVTPQELRAMLVEMGADTKYQQLRSSAFKAF
eukprot:1159686-Pelagomonas_calceolata.AAC.7